MTLTEALDILEKELEESEGSSSFEEAVLTILNRFRSMQVIMDVPFVPPPLEKSVDKTNELERRIRGVEKVVFGLQSTMKNLQTAIDGLKDGTDKHPLAKFTCNDCSRPVPQCVCLNPRNK